MPAGDAGKLQACSLATANCPSTFDTVGYACCRCCFSLLPMQVLVSCISPSSGDIDHSMVRACVCACVFVHPSHQSTVSASLQARRRRRPSQNWMDLLCFLLLVFVRCRIPGNAGNASTRVPTSAGFRRPRRFCRSRGKSPNRVFDCRRKGTLVGCSVGWLCLSHSHRRESGWFVGSRARC